MDEELTETERAALHAAQQRQRRQDRDRETWETANGYARLARHRLEQAWAHEIVNSDELVEAQVWATLALAYEQRLTRPSA